MAGENTDGQLGDGSQRSSSAFLQAISSGVKAVAAGASHSVVVKQDGSVWTTGQNTYGQLGDASMETSKTFKLVGGVGAVEAVYAGGRHSAIVKQDGKAYVAGDNVDGQLGLGLPGLSSSSKFLAVIPGDHHTASYVILLLLLNHSRSGPDIRLHNESGCEGAFPHKPRQHAYAIFASPTPPAGLYCSRASHSRGQH